MKKVLLSLFIVIVGCEYAEAKDKDVLFQTSNAYMLLEGMYDGDVTYAELGKHGDIGLGTFNGLDGEMIELDGRFYQVKADGKVYQVIGNEKTPFAEVTFFESDKIITINKELDLGQLVSCLAKEFPSRDNFYAFKVEGKFKYIKARSVPKQNKPYPRFSEVVKSQSIFEFSDIEGTIVGIWCPEKAKDVNVAGFHMHFISKDKKAGGHLLECTTKQVKAEIDETISSFLLAEKGNTDPGAFEDKQRELEKAEN